MSRTMSLSRVPLFPVAITLALTAVACGGSSETAPAAAAPSASASVSAANAPPKYASVPRDTFNRLAVRYNLPLFWVADKNGNHAVDPDEVVSLLFYTPREGDGKAMRWVDGGTFTPAFDAAYAKIAQGEPKIPDGLPAAEVERRKLVGEDLDQGFTTLVRSDLTGLSSDEKAFVRHIFAAASLIDTLYLTQNGTLDLAKEVPADDPSSQALFSRDRGPRCAGIKTEKNPVCNAIPRLAVAGAPRVPVDVYPRELQAQPKFCEALEKNPNAKKLLEPFSVVRDKGGKLEAVPYSEAYKELMTAVAGELREAAGTITDPKEAPLKAYVTAAAQSFTDNNWLPADEAWSRMTSTNSKFYLRIAPDETYWEPCSHKASFHTTFALINRDSLAWQEKLTPVQQEMEQLLAKTIGAPYKPRKVTFHLPDFIDIIINTGDDRQPTGGTIGESLPNWGKVAAEGRGRTVAMSNLFTDADTLAHRREQVESLFTKEAMAIYKDDPKAGLLSTILHEATHNLGPTNEYVYGGKSPALAFGGGIASMMEELKAQTGALFYTDFVKAKGIIDPDSATRSYLADVVWSFGHISRGMYTPTGERKPYSQLAAIQVGFLMDEGAITFDPNAAAANGKDKGAFSVHPEKFVPAIEKMTKTVGHIKATNDKAGAEALAKRYVDGNVVPMQTITERYLRQPIGSLVYAVDL